MPGILGLRMLAAGVALPLLSFIGSMSVHAQSGEVAVYTSMAEPAIQAVEKAFEADHPEIDVAVLRLVTGTLTTRFANEAQSGVDAADVLIIATPTLFKTNPEWFLPLAGAEVANYETWPQKFRAANFAQALFGSNTIFYNTNTVSLEDAPKVWQDLLKPRWKGKAVMIDPSASETYMSWALNMRKAFGDQYLSDLGKQDLVIAKGGLDAAQAVASGAADVSFSAMANQADGLLAKGAPIGVVEMTAPALGNEHSIGIAAKAPHMDNAKIFTNWFLSEKGQSAACVGSAASALGEVPGCKRLPSDFIPPSFDIPAADSDTVLGLLGIK